MKKKDNKHNFSFLNIFVIIVVVLILIIFLISPVIPGIDWYPDRWKLFE